MICGRGKMETVRDMLLDPLKGKNQAQNILTFLFREVLIWRKVTLRLWNKRFEEFFKKPHNAGYQDRGNFNKAVKSNEMQWQTFKRVIDLLNPESATLVLKLTFSDDDIKEYPIDLNPLEDETNPKINNLPWDNCNIFENSKPCENLLAHLIRHIYAEQTKDVKNPVKWFNKTIKDYIEQPRNVLGFNENDVSSLRNALKKDVTDESLTWNKLRRAIHLLRPMKEEYVLKLTWPVVSRLVKPLPDTVIRIEITDPHLTIKD